MRTRALLIALTAGLTLACGSYSGPTAPPADPPDPAPDDVVIVRGASALTTTAFDPNPRTLALDGGDGVGVRWVNQDGAVEHQIASDDGAFATSGTLGGGATYAVTLPEAGTYRYHCAIHPNMVGTITVTP